MKKVIIITLIFIMAAANFVVLFDKNDVSNLTLSSLLNLATAEAEVEIIIPIPEVVVKPSEKEVGCIYESGFSIGISVGSPNGISIDYSTNYEYGYEIVCSEDNGDGCDPEDCA